MDEEPSLEGCDGDSTGLVVRVKGFCFEGSVCLDGACGVVTRDDPGVEVSEQLCAAVERCVGQKVCLHVCTLVSLIIASIFDTGRLTLHLI